MKQLFHFSSLPIPPINDSCLKVFLSNNFNALYKLWRPFLLVLATIFLFASTALAQKPAASLEQIRNGSATQPVDPAQWQNGNAGNQTAHYVEGHSIGYRALLTALPANTTVNLILGYDVTHSSKNAIDFLTHYDRLQPHGQFLTGGNHPAQEVVDPRLGTSFAGQAPTSTYEIPRPEANNANDVPGTVWDAIPAAKRLMSLWGGGQITDIQYATPLADLTVAQSEQRIIVTFTTGAGGSAVLAWGGHIANRQDWGFTTAGVPLSAGGISGSPYHMRLINWELGNLGNQDRSLSAAAVIPPPGCALTGAAAVCAGTSNVYSTTEIADSYAWTLINNTSGASFSPAPTSTSTSVTVLAGANAGSYTVKLVTTKGGITSTDVCEIPVTVSNPVAPAVVYNPPACDEATFSITVGSLANPIIAGAQYTVRDKNNALITTLKVNGTSVSNPYTAPSPAPGTIIFTNIAAGSGFKVTVTINGCTSGEFACPTVTTSSIQSIQSIRAPESNLAVTTETQMKVYPIPFSDKTTIEFRSVKSEDYVINLYDLKGNLVKQLKSGKAKAGEITKVEVDGRGMAESMYLVRKVSKTGVSTVKLLKKL